MEENIKGENAMMKKRENKQVNKEVEEEEVKNRVKRERDEGITK